MSRYIKMMGYRDGEKNTVLITDRVETIEWFARVMDRVEYTADGAEAMRESGEAICPSPDRDGVWR